MTLKKKKEKQELITKQKKSWKDGMTNHYMGSIRQEQLRKV